MPHLLFFFPFLLLVRTMHLCRIHLRLFLCENMSSNGSRWSITEVSACMPSLNGGRSLSNMVFSLEHPFFRSKIQLATEMKILPIIAFLFCFSFCGSHFLFSNNYV